MSETVAVGRRPGRPPDEAGPVITRAELLETAMAMIAAKGFSGTSIRGLAREAGVTHGTVQHHFPTKQALWEALVDEVLVPRLATPSEQLAAEIGGGLEAAIATRLRLAMTRPGLSGAILMDNSDGADDRLAYLANAAQSIRTGAMSQLQALIAGGALRSVNPSVFIALDIALACVGSADVALHTFLDIDSSDEEQREKLAAEISEVILHGLIPRE